MIFAAGEFAASRWLTTHIVGYFEWMATQTRRNSIVSLLKTFVLPVRPGGIIVQDELSVESANEKSPRH
jgi:hypothetical protein